MSEIEFNKVFSKRLKYYLGINNMTQVELSKRLNVGTTSVSNWCKGLKSPRMDKVDAMCTIFHCRRSDLMELPEERTSSSLNDTTDLITSDDRMLVEHYHKLNDIGKAKAREYVTDLTENEKYTALEKEPASYISNAG